MSTELLGLLLAMLEGGAEAERRALAQQVRAAFTASFVPVGP